MILFQLIGQYSSKCTRILSSAAAVCAFLVVCQRDLRVHSVSGVPELMWRLSIQMCPLVPCEKKPSITTWRRKTGGGGKKTEEEDEANEDGGQGWRGRRKTMKSLCAAFDSSAAFAPLQASLADFFMRTLTACEVPDVYAVAYRDNVTYFGSFQSQTWPGVTEGLKKKRCFHMLRDECFSCSNQL